MKIIAFHNYYETYNVDDCMFKSKNIHIGDDLLAPMIALKEYACQQGIRVATSGVLIDEKPDAFVFMDMPDINNTFFNTAVHSGKPCYLITFEPGIINRNNYKVNNHRYFQKIFTHNDALVDNKKYIKINYAYEFPSEIPKNFSSKSKLCTMIAGNKKSHRPLELYSKRKEVIRWFEKNHPEEFDLYGIGWDKDYLTRDNFRKLLNPRKLIKALLSRPYTSWRGVIDRKRPVLEKYKFSICFENVRDVPGYITEKIFDCFFAGCVPVYWGANNINEHIPAECFIDWRNFKNCDALYDFLVGMSDHEYRAYIENIESFLKSEKAYPFSIDCFCKTILKEICET